MSDRVDQNYLRDDQYKNSANLSARGQLHERFSVNQYGWHRWLFDQFSLPPEASILELGCGPGWLWQKNADRLPKGWRITLTDFSTGMLDEARQNLRGMPPVFAFEIADAQSLPFPDDHFDRVMAHHMLYHVPDRAKALREIRRVLKPGGHFYAATNGRNHLAEIPQLVERFVPGTAMWENMLSPFRLEDGADELRQVFGTVLMHEYKDGLVVTDADALIAYILSTSIHLEGETLAAFRGHLVHEIATQGAIRITKSSGVFAAW